MFVFMYQSNFYVNISLTSFSFALEICLPLEILLSKPIVESLGNDGNENESVRKTQCAQYTHFAEGGGYM